MKTIESWVCTDCGHTQRKWSGSCTACSEWNTMEKFVEAKEKKREYGLAKTKPIASVDVVSEKEEKMTTGFAEIDRVFGEGVALGSLNLVGGDPGIGKSTLMLQLASQFCKMGKKVLYVCGEESLSQTAHRAERLGALHDDLFLLSETEFAAIRTELDLMKPDIFILDSIQIVYKSDLPSLPGSISQVKEIAVECMHVAKQNGITTFLIGHVTKGGDLAGPKVLEHIVDTVVDFEGDRDHGFRMLRAHKNRFGPTDEVAILQMGQKGLEEVPNPSKLFLEERAHGQPGSVIGATMEGSKPMLLEVQALISPSVFPTPARRANGIENNRLAILLAVLEKRMGYHFQNFDVFVSIAGGMRVRDPALDLAALIAIASSFCNKAVDAGTLVIGEIGLGGEIRTVPRIDRRVREAKHLGFTNCILPKGKSGDKYALPATHVKKVDEAIKELLG